MEKFERQRDMKEKTIGHDAKAAKHAGELFHFAHVYHPKAIRPVGFHSSNSGP